LEPTTNLLGNGLHTVLHDPPAGAALRDGSAPAPAFVEEVLRFDSPVQLTSRIGYDTKVGGVPVPAGIGVTTLLGAGNRVPRRFADPDRFDPMRPDGGPLSFGGGAHFCIGAALARLRGLVGQARGYGRTPPAADRVPGDRGCGRAGPPGPIRPAWLRRAAGYRRLNRPPLRAAGIRASANPSAGRVLSRWKYLSQVRGVK